MRLPVVVLTMLLSAVTVLAEEAPPPAQPATPTTPSSPAAPANAPSDGKPQDFKGELSVKGLDAKPGVVAIMKVPKGDNAVEWVDLLATGDLAAKVEDLASQHATLTITGTRAGNGITVTKVGDDVKLPPAKKKKKK